MRRSGVIYDTLLKWANIAVMVLILMATVLYTFTLLNNSGVETSAVYLTHGMAEEVISAPCATRSRGEFYVSALKGGDFHCISPSVGNLVYIEAIFSSSETYDWYVYRRSSGEIVVEAAIGTNDDQFRPNLLGDPRRFDLQAYDTATGTHQQVEVRVRGGHGDLSTMLGGGG